jgi:hypothetical protein
LLPLPMFGSPECGRLCVAPACRSIGKIPGRPQVW